MALTAKIMALYLLLGSFLPQSDFSQLLKLSKLVEHYDFHVAQAEVQGSTFSVREYVYNHFIHPDHHEHGDDSHHDLPLQTVNSGPLMLMEETSFLLKVPSPTQQQAHFPAFLIISERHSDLPLRPPIG